MKIQVLNMKLHNFKGIRSLEIDFSQHTKIDGDNGTGKTTIQDAFTWCLFGKDSTGAKDFEIKTLDENNQPFHRLEHSVEVLLDIDGMHMKLKRVFKEKWTKKRGFEEVVFDGHVSSFFWDEVPVSASEFKQKVESVCDEELFKLLTSVSAFNSLHWKDKRKVLVDIVGEVSDEDVAASDDKLKALLESLNGKSIEDQKKMLAHKRKNINDELKQFAPRIDEVERSKPEPVDESIYKAELEELKKDLDKVEAAQADDAKAHEAVMQKKKAKQEELFKLEEALSIQQKIYQKKNDDKKHEAESSRNVLSRKVDELRAEYGSKLSIANKKAIHAQAIEDDLVKLRSNYKSESEKEFKIDSSKLECPTCKRPYDDAESKSSEFRANFNTEKARKLEEINEKGRKLKLELEEFKPSLEQALKEKNEASEALTKATEELNAWKLDFTPEPEPKIIGELKYDIEQMKKEVDSMQYTSNDFSEEKKVINQSMDAIKAKLQAGDAIKKADARISELKKQEKDLADELTRIEGQEFLCDEFTVKRVEMIENAVNNRFKICKFKMFNHLINGGFEETCEAMINGVPYSSLNNAARINSGIDIINTLCEHYEVNAPIFIDNAESINDILETDSQIITLTVSKSKQLKINQNAKRKHSS